MSDGAAVAQRARAAGVVADHPADACTRCACDGSGPKRSPCGRGGRCRRPGRRRARRRAVRASGSTSRTRFRCREKSSTTPGPDGVAGDRGAGAPRRSAGRPGSRQTSSAAATSSTSRGEGDRPREHPVERGVGGVLAPGPGRRRRLRHPGPAQGGQQVGVGLGDSVDSSRGPVPRPVRRGCGWEWAGASPPVAEGRDRVAGAQRRLLEPALVRDDRTPVAGQLGVPLLEGLPPASAVRRRRGDVVAVAVVGALPGLRHLLGRRAAPRPARRSRSGTGDLARRGAARRGSRGSGAVKDWITSSGVALGAQRRS